jgi:hypothetical protein
MRPLESLNTIVLYIIRLQDKKGYAFPEKALQRTGETTANRESFL